MCTRDRDPMDWLTIIPLGAAVIGALVALAGIFLKGRLGASADELRWQRERHADERRWQRERQMRFIEIATQAAVAFLAATEMVARTSAEITAFHADVQAAAGGSQEERSASTVKFDDARRRHFAHVADGERALTTLYLVAGPDTGAVAEDYLTEAKRADGRSSEVRTQLRLRTEQKLRAELGITAFGGSA
jgi:hypothetical protein